MSRTQTLLSLIEYVGPVSLRWLKGCLPWPVERIKKALIRLVSYGVLTVCNIGQRRHWAVA